MTTNFEIEPSQRSPLRRAGLWLSRAITTVVYVYFLIVEIILGLGFCLLLFGANPTSGFVDWVYRSMDRAMEPFRGIFSSVELGEMPNEVDSVFDTSVLFAMIFYGILVLVISAVVDWLNTRAQRLDSIDAEYRRRQVFEQSYGATAVPPTGAPPTGTTGAAPTPPERPPTP